MPQANVWQRCACPASELHARDACPRVAGFERRYDWICMPCLTCCGLVIIPSAPEARWVNGRWDLPVPGQTGLVVAEPPLRAGDADREEGYAALAAAFEQGQLDLAEYERRLDLTGDATYRSEIRACTADLKG